MTHITSPRWTVRSMPLSTSSAAEALVHALGQHHRRGLRRRRRGHGSPPLTAERHRRTGRSAAGCRRRAAPQLLQRRRRQRALAAAGVVPLEVVLPDHEHRGDRQIPDRRRRSASAPAGRARMRRSSRRARVEVGGSGTATTSEVVFSMVISLVAGRRDDHPHRLRQHDPAHDLRRGACPAPPPPRSGPRRPTGCRRGRSRPCTRPRSAPSPSSAATKNVITLRRRRSSTNSGPNGIPNASLRVEHADQAPEDQLGVDRACRGRTRCRPRRPRTAPGSATAA